MNFRRKRVPPAGDGWDSPYSQDMILRCVVSRAQCLCTCSPEEAQAWIRDACGLFLPTGEPIADEEDATILPRARVEAALALGVGRGSRPGPALLVTRVVMFRGISLYADIMQEPCPLDESLFVATERFGAELVLYQLNVSQALVDLAVRCCPSLQTLRLYGTSIICMDRASHLISGHLVDGGCTRCAFRGGERLFDAVCRNAWASLQEFDVRGHGLRTVYEDRLHSLRWVARPPPRVRCTHPDPRLHRRYKRIDLRFSDHIPASRVKGFLSDPELGPGCLEVRRSDATPPCRCGSACWRICRACRWGRTDAGPAGTLRVGGSAMQAVHAGAHALLPRDPAAPHPLHRHGTGEHTPQVKAGCACGC